MSNRPYDLPSLSALASFEAAARHVSFKEAASELNVTPAAVSHQIKALEADLDLELFHRQRRGVSLSEAGEALLKSVQKGLVEMSDAVSALRRQSASRAVKIQATTAVSSLWLTPRLAKFWREHDTIQVTQHVSDAVQLVEDCDLSIHYGNVTEDAGDCQTLFHGPIVALASPTLMAKNQVTSLGDLARLPLIHLNAEGQNWTDWQEWFAALGFDGDVGQGLRVNNYIIALQAAQDGMGVVLGWESLTSSQLEAGTLVPALPDKIETPNDFYIKTRKNASAQALLLRDWLVAGQT